MKTTLKKIASLLICLCLIISGMVISASAAETTEITFDFGDNGTASHSDGSIMSASKSYTVDGYTLTLTSAANCYTGAKDAKGNSALKLGASSKAGSFTITVPDDVVSVIFNVAKYKANTSKVKINETTTTLTKASNNGEYDALSVDTSTNKTITFTTVSGGYRCMINSIIYVVETTTGGEGGETPDPTPEPEPEPEPEPTPDPEEPSGNQEAVTNTYTFSSYTAGSQYVDGTHALDDEVSLSTHLSRCHFTEQLRIYGKTDTQSAGYAVLSSKREITALSINAGHKATTVNVYVSSNGSDWNSTNPVVSTASYKDYTVTIPAGTKFVKFEATDAQIRIASMTVSLAAVKAPVAEMGGTSATVGANLGIAQSITLKTEDAANKTFRMDFTLNGETTKVNPVITDGNYSFSFNNIPAHFMTEKITAKLVVVDNGQEVDQGTKEYTIAQYAKALLESDAYTAEVKKFVANMITYGAAAQKKANHNTNNLATAGLETLISQYGSTEAPSADNKMSLSKTDSDVRFYSANIRFGDTNSLIIKLNDFNENTSVVVRKGDEIIATYSNTKQCVIEGLKATDYATKFIFELKDGDAVIQTLTYGINSYAYAKKADANMQELALALYAYGKSANAIG